jgi:hypothetical protein
MELIGEADHKAYLPRMRNLNIVQFVCFETTLASDQFIRRWEEYHRSENSDTNVTLQQHEGEKIYNYLAQHRGAGNELRFFFSKGKSSPRVHREQITTKQAGGYLVLQEERMTETRRDESKIFVFLTSPQVDLNAYKQTGVDAQLNVYEAYYENCKYAYIHEFFVKNKYVSELIEQLKKLGPCEIGIYKECSMQPA